MATPKLTRKQKFFVKEYLVDLNASAAARRAGYSPKSAFRMGQENMQKPAVLGALQSQLNEKYKKLDISSDRILNEYARCAFYKISDYFDDNGMLKEISEIPEDAVAAIHGLEVISTQDGDTKISKFKLPDKAKHLEALSKYQGLFERDNRQKRPVINVPDYEAPE